MDSQHNILFFSYKRVKVSMTVKQYNVASEKLIELNERRGNLVLTTCPVHLFVLSILSSITHWMVAIYEAQWKSLVMEVLVQCVPLVISGMK